MAIDGFNIIDSDLAHDIRSKILNLYDEKKSEQDIKSYLKSELHQLEEPLSMEIFITSSCLTLWEIGLLDDYFLEQLETVVSSGADQFWLRSFDSINYDKRNTALQKLLAKVSKPAVKIRKPKKYKCITNHLYAKGDILAPKIDNEYHCIIFNHFWQYRNDAYYSFVVTTYHRSVRPSADDLLVEEVPVTKTKTGEIGVRTLDISYKSIENLKSDLIKIGTAKLDPKAEQSGFSSYGMRVDNLNGLKKEIETILQGLKKELWFILLDLTVTNGDEPHCL